MIERELEKELIRLASLYKVLSVYGPRQVGKTTLTKSIFMALDEYLNLEDSSVLNQAVVDPKGFLINHPSPLIIDEIQVFPELVSQIQANVDEKSQKWQYIITGSYQVKLRDAIAQSLAGRTAVVHMLPLLSLRRRESDWTVIHSSSRASCRHISIQLRIPLQASIIATTRSTTLRRT